MGSEKVVKVTDANYDVEVANSNIPVLLDFGADWCMPCRMIAPTIEELAEEYDGRIKVGQVNTDESRETAMRFGISAIPTLLLFKNGEVVKKFVGLKSKRDLKEEIDTVLG